MSTANLIAGVRWLCNRLYRPPAFEHRLTRFIDLFEPPQPRPNATGQQAAPLRQVDVERVELAQHVSRLGPREAAMAERLQVRVQRKPATLPLVLLALGYYMQIRQIYQTSGLWDPALADNLVRYLKKEIC